MASRRRFTPEQREAVLKARAKQQRACARGRHYWYPDYGLIPKNAQPRGKPETWTVEQRFPVPIWDGQTIICTGCNLRGELKNIPPKRQIWIRDIIKCFTDNAVSMQKDYEEPTP